MSDVTLTIRLPRETHSSLELLAQNTDRPSGVLIREAVARYVESETEIIEGIKQAQAELRAGKGVAHEEVARAGREIVERALARDARKA